MHSLGQSLGAGLAAVCRQSCAQALPGEQQQEVAPCSGSAGAWSVQPRQAGKAEIGLVAASEPQGWDLQGGLAQPLPGNCPHLLRCQPDMAEAVLLLSGVELMFFPLAGTVLGFGMRTMVMK